MLVGIAPSAAGRDGLALLRAFVGRVWSLARLHRRGLPFDRAGLGRP